MIPVHMCGRKLSLREPTLQIKLSQYMQAIGRRTHSTTPCFRKSSNFMPPSAFDFSILRLQRRLFHILHLRALSLSAVLAARGQWHMLFWNEARLAVCNDDQRTAQAATIGCDKDCMPTCRAFRQPQYLQQQKQTPTFIFVDGHELANKATSAQLLQALENCHCASIHIPFVVLPKLCDDEVRHEGCSFFAWFSTTYTAPHCKLEVRIGTATVDIGAHGLQVQVWQEPKLLVRAYHVVS